MEAEVLGKEIMSLFVDWFLGEPGFCFCEAP